MSDSDVLAEQKQGQYEQLRDLKPYLVSCAAACDYFRRKQRKSRKCKRKRKIRKPFGSPALYSSKLKAPRGGIANMPGHANRYLAKMHANGWGVKKDVKRAIEYLRVAIEEHGFTEFQSDLDELL